MQNILKLKPLSAFVVAILIFFVVPGVADAQTNLAPSRITQVVDETRLTTLQGNAHPLARAEFDQGAAPSTLPMQRMLLVLTRSSQQESALETLLEQQQDASSANYHRWLNPQQFGQQFGPSDQDIQIITTWLQSHGFQIASVSNGRTVIEFSGTAGEVQEAFHTAIHRYTENGEDHWANASDPQIPTALAPVVAGIDTLNNFPRNAMHHVAGAVYRSAKTGQIQSNQPLFTLGGECGVTPACYGVGPYDFATIYDVSPLWNATTPIDGTGETIAIVGETDINLQDIASFRNYFGLAANAPNVMVEGPDPGTVPVDETESDLDVEWSGAVAKGATIDLVVSESTEASPGVDLSAQYIVDNNLAPILSESYGICELFLGTAGNQFYNQLWQQASAEGITAIVSTGDSGSATCDRNAGTEGAAQYGLSVNGFASTPYDVAVGGTDFNDLTNATAYWGANTVPPGHPTLPPTVSALSYIPETTWNDSCTNAVFGNLLGFSANPETNCNNVELENDGFVVAVGGSGGKSNCMTSSGTSPSDCTQGYAKPLWQTALTPNDSARDIPDLSLFAASGSPSGAFYLICEADLIQAGETSCDTSDPETQFIGIGGTSASAPAFAGIMALIDQKTGSRQGNANYILYQLAAQAGASCNSSSGTGSGCWFYDVTNGTIAMPCVSGSPNCTVSTPGDLNGVLSGYATTTGYDLATGLGSVNVANLANSWAAFVPSLKLSSTTLTLNGGSAVNITHGQSVSVAIDVAAQPPASGTPGGNVSLIASTGATGTENIQAFSLAGGDSVSSTTSALPGGSSYSVTAEYPGDGTFGASQSSPVSVTVNPESSKTFADLVTLTVNGSPTSFSASSGTYGSGYNFFRVDVGNSAATLSPSTGISSTCSQGATNCPTGTVTFTSTGAPLGVASLPLNSRGYAEIQSLPVGSYAVTASYPGDSSYGPSTAGVSFTIAKAPTTVSAAVDGMPIQYGDDDQISATILTNSDGVAPTGTVSFFLDGNPLSVPHPVYEGSPYEPNSSSSPQFATLSAEGDAVFLSLGQHTLTAQYSGDTNYAAATSGPTTITVTKAQPFFTSIGAGTPTTNINQQVTLSATMGGSDAGVPPTGTMTFYVDGTAVSGTISYTTLAAGLSASMPYTPTVAGTHSITASYSGDSNYLPANSGSFTLTVIGPTFSISTQGSTIQTVTAGQTATYTNVLNVSYVNGFSGTVNLSCSVPADGTTCAVNPSSMSGAGSASVTVTTTSRTLAPFVPSNRIEPFLRLIFAIGLLGVALALFLRFASGRRLRAGTAMAVVAIVLLMLVGTISGCGGESGGGGSSSGNTQQSGTPANTYVVTVTGTSGALTHTTNLALVVQ